MSCSKCQRGLSLWFSFGGQWKDSEEKKVLMNENSAVWCQVTSNIQSHSSRYYSCYNLTDTHNSTTTPHSLCFLIECLDVFVEGILDIYVCMYFLTYHWIWDWGSVLVQSGFTGPLVTSSAGTNPHPGTTHLALHTQQYKESYKHRHRCSVRTMTWLNTCDQDKFIFHLNLLKPRKTRAR